MFIRLINIVMMMMRSLSLDPQYVPVTRPSVRPRHSTLSTSPSLDPQYVPVTRPSVRPRHSTLSTSPSLDPQYVPVTRPSVRPRHPPLSWGVFSVSSDEELSTQNILFCVRCGIRIGPIRRLDGHFVRHLHMLRQFRANVIWIVTF